MNSSTAITALMVMITLLVAAGAAVAAPALSGELPARDQVPVNETWDLSVLYPDDAAWQADCDKVRQLCQKISRYSAVASWSAGDLANVLELRDQISQLINERIYPYASLHKDEDTSNSHYQAMAGQAQTLSAEAGVATAFIEPMINNMPQAQLISYYQTEPRLKPYKFYLQNIIRLREHILPEREEQLLSRAGEVTAAPATIFGALTTADIRFPAIDDGQGNKVTLSSGRYYTFITSNDRTVRQQAFTEYQGSYRQYRNTLAATLDAHVKSEVFVSKSRNYQSARQMALSGDNIPPEVYDNLIDTVNANLPALHRYVALKKKLLGLDEMHMYDLYAPLVPDIDWPIEYDQAEATILAALSPLGGDYAGKLKEALSSRWIDVRETQNKRTGAYSWGLYGSHPFILLNWNNRLNDLSTLAHELGHAMHSYYSNTSQPFATAGYATFTAETASTVNENLLSEYLIAHTDDRQKKLYLINQKLEDIRATLFRQTMFAEFEREIYRYVEAGNTLTADYLDKIYHDLNVKYFGPGIVVDSPIDCEWSRIPHFYRFFYVYQYATGLSAATAISTAILNNPAEAVPRYIEFLKSGGSDYPLNLLKKAGVDMTTPAPVQLTLDKFSQLLDEFARLSETAG
ncbi:MAG: oligoendopeptidase F [Negativicutes bacterium]|nr:oligoendopeptidase F [Negativicutes bacterium]